jgi:hypothetical protein
MKRRHPAVQAEIDRVYKEQLGEKRDDPKGAPVVRLGPEKDRDE